MTITTITPMPTDLLSLGWKPILQQQLLLEEYDSCYPARVIEQHRTILQCQSEQGVIDLAIKASMPSITVGDWILINSQQQFIRLLNRFSSFSRKAPGSKIQRQCIAANIDTVFIVSSMNQDFNLNRIERFLALAHEAEVEPVIVLSKLDQCEEPQHYTEQAQALDKIMAVITVNSLDTHSVKQLKSWCTPGNTIAFMGSSGVGKSSLINTLSGEAQQATAGIREDDSKGRHTTTGRSLLPLKDAGLLLDTPGMRELQILDCEHGVEETFAEIQQLAQQCKFNDCQHEQEPGCAITAALKSGKLDERRLKSYQKLKREQAFNSATLAQKRETDKSFTQHIKQVQNSNRKMKKH